MGGVKTYADGGSATSQASDLETNRWQSRPWAARALRASAFLAPLVGSFVLTRAYAALVPPEPIGRPAYWGGMLVVASATAIVIELVRSTSVLKVPTGMLSADAAFANCQLY